jgi:hypothetical protein
MCKKDAGHLTNKCTADVSGLTDLTPYAKVNKSSDIAVLCL